MSYLIETYIILKALHFILKKKSTQKNQTRIISNHFFENCFISSSLRFKCPCSLILSFLSFLEIFPAVGRKNCSWKSVSSLLTTAFPSPSTLSMTSSLLLVWLLSTCSQSATSFSPGCDGTRSGWYVCLITGSQYTSLPPTRRFLALKLSRSVRSWYSVYATFSGICLSRYSSGIAWLE